MTRWARAGSTQKHKKMPEDPTSWEEFAAQRKALVKNENKIKKISNEAASTSFKKKLKLKQKKVKIRVTPEESMPMVKADERHQTGNAPKEVDLISDFTDESYSQDPAFLKKGVKSEVKGKKSKTKFLDGALGTFLKGKKMKSGKKKIRKNGMQTPLLSNDESICAEETSVSGSFQNKEHEGEKKGDAKLVNREEYELAVASNVDSSSEKELIESSLPSMRHNVNKQKQKSFFEKVKANRAENGILLLPRNVENKLYRMKKKLREKGLSGEQIKRMLREARRKAELKYRKTLKTCFNCRKTGHVLANCPSIVEDHEQGTGICFKCGSTEHVSYKCHIKTSEFPFAKCFICHNTGHISKNCPENKNGIYPKGGKCNLCGSVYHLRKDCPKSSNSKGGESEEVTAHVISELRSVDDEIADTQFTTVKQKKPKLVKF